MGVFVKVQSIQGIVGRLTLQYYRGGILVTMEGSYKRIVLDIVEMVTVI